jgi:uncharacterized protein
VVTLFAIASREGESVFRRALDRYCEGHLDDRTFGPIFWENADGAVIAADWAEGFLHAVALRADAWEPLMRSKRHGRLLLPILALCVDEHGDSALGLEPDEEERMMAEAAELIPVCVTEIAAYWRKRRPTPLAMGSSQPVSVSLTANQPGRNDPCPCGSGRKFRVCCGRLH